MVTKKIVSFLFLVALSASTVAQQTTLPAAQPSPDAQQQEEKEKLEKQALALLDQVVTDSQGLRLPENKIRVQIAAADMLWDKSAARARDLLTNAAAMLAQIMAGYDRSNRDDFQMLNQLRQELVLSAGRHDAELAYQLLRSTQPPAQTTATTNRPGRPFAIEPGNNLEQSLLATIAAHDPKFAYQKTVESLDKGEFPTSLNRVLNQLQTKEPDLFKKLTDKTLSRLASDNLLASRQATTVATGLLFPGPRANTTTSTSETVNANTNSRPGTTPLLNETAYRDLLESAITAALSFTGSAQTNMQRGGAGAPRVMRGQAAPAQRPQQQNPPDEAQTRQNNARTMLFSLQGILPHIEQYAPARAQAVRQKLTEVGVNNNQMNFGNQVRAALQDGGSSDSLIAAAASAPPQAQSFIYREAAQRAIEEGNTDRALQIANEHLNEQGRNAIVQAVDFKLLTTSASPEKLNEIKQKLAALSSDSERVRYLIELATATRKDNPKLALKFLDDAHALVAKRATRYRDFEDQIKVAEAFKTLDAKRSFAIMDAGIGQLNELLAAATVLNGFEMNIFKDGELSSRGDSDLTRMVLSYSLELGSLAKIDFAGAQSTADKFQLAEARMTARLSMVQSILGAQPLANPNRRGNIQFFPR